MTGGTFNNTNSVIMFNGNTDQNIQTIAPFNSLNVNKTSVLFTLSNDVTVNAILSFSKGNIQTGNNKIIIPALGSVTGAAKTTGWVNGNLQRNFSIGSNGLRLFDIGDSGFYSPATVQFANVSTSGNVVAAVIGKEHPQIDFSGISKDLDVNGNKIIPR